MPVTFLPTPKPVQETVSELKPSSKAKRNRLTNLEKKSLKENVRILYLEGHPRKAIALKLNLSDDQVDKFLSMVLVEGKDLQFQESSYALLKLTASLRALFPNGYFPVDCK